MSNPENNLVPVVRFAPSPTGYLHVGGARTALFNFLFARHHGGIFILRIEDTDQKRFQAEALQEIFASLKWLGLNWDEGPEAGGERGPYFQSQRTALYRRHAEQLLAAGKAYRCFCSEERLARMREEQEKAKMAHGSGYDRHCRLRPEAEVKALLAANAAHVVRLKVPDNRVVVFNDLIRGEISYDSSQLDDLVLLKSDGFPTYHLANVVDDHLMQITHVLRGDEWIVSTPKHILIYEAFGWPPPHFAHMPVILAADGGKLSKRRGAASVLDYQRSGFQPEALLNFLVLLGWAPGGDREIMTLDEMTAAFSLQRVSAKAAVFDETKLEWMNGHYLQQRSQESLLPEVMACWEKLLPPPPAVLADQAYAKKVIGLFKERSKKIIEIAENSGYFFRDPAAYDPQAARKYFKSETISILELLAEKLAALEPFSHEALEGLYRQVAEGLGLPAGKLIHPTRLAVSGVSFGPGLFEMLELLGKETVIRRLQSAGNWIGTAAGKEE
ncbi:MAG: glutamate--tRNA ligase [Acidobacteria bacterium]|nr:glutamate--tRNA ligase [Acidobacteriota bacterium]MBU4306235.1 glutamate--tRNA ligase [Acidobacteriota bacterium]MBU4404155.1 glutamate--tRNA ligase [Acidobacteriota bacterium]MCG2810838.1 glutamate--tRNA ligase [Candidatus Aminicenantes bacterium]